MANFSFNRKNIIIRLLPTLLRKSKIIAYLFVLTAPINILYIEMLAYFSIVNEQISNSGQTLMFEYMLRQKYNDVSIQVINHVGVNPVTKIGYYGEDFSNTIGYPSENASCNVGYASEMSDLNYNFEILLPTSLSDKITEINALIAKYQILGTKGIITLI